MADDHAAVAPALSVGARIGGASTVVTLVSLAHAFSHAYGALLPLIVPFFVTDLQLTYTQVGFIFSISNLVWSPLQLGFGVLGRYCSRKLLLGIGHLCQGVAIIGTGHVHGFADLLSWRVVGRIADAPQHPIGNALISQSFRPDRRGLALSINAAVSNLGTVLVPLIGAFLIAYLDWRWRGTLVLQGWRGTLALFGMAGILVGILLLCLLEDHRGTKSPDSGSGEDRSRGVGPAQTPGRAASTDVARHRRRWAWPGCGDDLCATLPFADDARRRGSTRYPIDHYDGG